MKQATTVEQQIKEIEKRGMVIDVDSDTVISYFTIIGYYSLGFYLFPFEKTYPSLKNRTHEYNESAVFSDVILLYELNKEIRFIIQRYLSEFENYFKTLLIYKASNKYINNPTWFADGSILKFNAFSFDNIYKNVRSSNEPISNHHKNHKNAKYAPAWKTLEYLTFGQKEHIYNSLHSDLLKTEIANCFCIETVKMFKPYLSNAVRIRNICAHGGSLYNYKTPYPIKKIAKVNVGKGFSETSLIYTINHISYSMFNINCIHENISEMFSSEIESVLNNPKFARVRHFFIN